MKILFKKVCIGSDHAGYNLKEIIKNFLITKNISIFDLGPMNENSVEDKKFIPVNDEEVETIDLIIPNINKPQSEDKSYLPLTYKEILIQ